MYDKYSNIPIKTKEEHLAKVRDYVDSLYTTPDLKQLFIELTLKCNEHCRHCGSKCGVNETSVYDDIDKDQLTDDEIIAFLTKLKAQLKEENKKLPFLNITGGEPMLRKNFFELMHRITELGYSWGMTTNGTLIKDNETIEKLHYAGMKTVSISIDGLDITHDWFRQTPGGYDKAINAIKLLVEDGGFKNVMVTTVVHGKNIDELDSLQDIMRELKIDTWRIVNVEPIGRAKDNKEIQLIKSEYIEMLDFIKRQRELEKAFEICYGCNHWLGVENEHKFRNWYFKCTAGIKTGGIFYNGDIGGCLDIERRPETVMGNIRTDDFLDVWKNKFEIFRFNRADTSEKCKTCSEKENCRGNGFHTWNLDTNNPNLCMYEIYQTKDNREE